MIKVPDLGRILQQLDAPHRMRVTAFTTSNAWGRQRVEWWLTGPWTIRPLNFAGLGMQLGSQPNASGCKVHKARDIVYAYIIKP